MWSKVRSCAMVEEGGAKSPAREPSFMAGVKQGLKVKENIPGFPKASNLESTLPAGQEGSELRELLPAAPQGRGRCCKGVKMGWDWGEGVSEVGFSLRINAP